MIPCHHAYAELEKRIHFLKSVSHALKRNLKTSSVTSEIIDDAWSWAFKHVPRKYLDLSSEEEENISLFRKIILNYQTGLQPKGKSVHKISACFIQLINHEINSCYSWPSRHKYALAIIVLSLCVAAVILVGAYFFSALILPALFVVAANILFTAISIDYREKKLDQYKKNRKLIELVENEKKNGLPPIEAIKKVYNYLSDAGFSEKKLSILSKIAAAWTMSKDTYPVPQYDPASWEEWSDSDSSDDSIDSDHTENSEPPLIAGISMAIPRLPKLCGQWIGNATNEHSEHARTCSQ